MKMLGRALAVGLATTLMIGASAITANATSTNMGSNFSASNYNASAHKKEGTLKATGLLCKKAYTKKGYLVKGSQQVNSITGKFKSTQRFSAYVWTSEGGGVYGPDLAVKLKAKSATGYTTKYLKSTDTVALHIYSKTLLTGSSAESTVANLATCN